MMARAGVEGAAAAQITLNIIQQKSCSLIRSDLRFLYTVITNISPSESNYIISLLPYMGVVIDGTEDWINAINNSGKDKIQASLFTEIERTYYERMRNSIKLWQDDYSHVYDRLKEAYRIHNEYFGDICKPIAKKLRLYNIFGVDVVNGNYCGNTILCYLYTPFFMFGKEIGPYIKTLSEIGGKYISFFGATTQYPVDESFKFFSIDYGGFEKSPVGNVFSDRFVLFSILCQLNFIIYGVDAWVQEEVPAKLRFSYLLYFYLTDIVPQINVKLTTNFALDTKWRSDKFRNAMAHYKLGVSLDENELISGDPLFGLTHKYLGVDYFAVKDGVMQELKSLARQIESYLNLK